MSAGKYAANVKCLTYEAEEVKAALEKAFQLCGGAGKYVRPGQTVVLKANLLSGFKVEKAVTTHPAVIRELARLLLSAGAGRVIIADSPGGPYTQKHLHGVYEATGMAEAARDSGAELNADFGQTAVQFPAAAVAKKLDIIDAVKNADVVINVCKLKTHSLTGYTAAVKNLFGVIPGMIKVEMHGTHSDLNKFADFLVDVEQFIKDKVVLHICDAVIGMEGPGPSAGTPRAIGRILAAENPYALDVTALRIIEADVFSMPVIAAAVRRGLIGRGEEIEVRGETLEGSVIKGFKKVAVSSQQAFNIPKWFRPVFQRIATRRPVLKSKSMCRGCKKCYNHCPVSAIDMTAKHKAAFDYQKCIRCYCCQELCPYEAIKVKKGILNGFFRGKK